MTNQIVREQVEDKIRFIAEIDSTINVICERVRDDNAIIKEYPQTVKALADLAIARALL